MPNKKPTALVDTIVKGLIKKVEFQLNNVEGFMRFDVESAAIKSTYLTKASKELEDFLTNHIATQKAESIEVQE